MRIIGITGGTGCGKSIVAQAFSSHGYPTFDCDAVYHQMTSYRSPCVVELERAFGEEVVDENGALLRSILRDKVFSSGPDAPLRLALLNEITHKHVKTAIFTWCEEMSQLGHHAVVIDAPTLFEAALEKDCVAVVGVVAPKELRIARIVSRDHITPRMAEMRIKAQHDNEFYRKHCDYIVENGTTTDAVVVQTEEIINDMIKRGILQ